MSHSTWRNVHIAGRAVPGIQIGEAESVMVELPSGKRIPSQFADILTLRETNPDGPNAGQKYLTVTRENLRFTTLRFEPVVGLDYDENGVKLTIQMLEERRAADIAARQQANLAAKAPVLVPLDEDAS